MSGSYREIKVWQKAIELVVDIYSCTRGFPNEEMFGLTSQLRRRGLDLRAISPKAKAVVPTGSSCNFRITLADPSLRGRDPAHHCQPACVTCQKLKLLRLGNSASEIARMLNGLIKAITSIADKQVA